jgi:cation diffusion facilitator family transporter
MAGKEDFQRGIRSAQLGILINALLAATKLVAGVVGNSYALIADAVESTADIVSSLIVMTGLQISSREPNKMYPFGYGRAETLAAATVAMMLIGTAIGISVEAVREIMTPHHAPAAWTLIVLVTVIIVKWLVSRRVKSTGDAIGSGSLKADAWHHLSDALTSAAAFSGISISTWMGPGWESADDWAALFASVIICINGFLMFRSALRDLMDRTPEQDVIDRIRDIAQKVPDVLAIEKLMVRRAGMMLFAEIHVQASPQMTLDEAHRLGGKVKAAVRGAMNEVAGILIHMEPYEGESAPSTHEK